MRHLLPLLLLVWAASAPAILCLKVNQAVADAESPYDHFRDEEYPAFDPNLRDGSFVPRMVRKRSYFVRDAALVIEVVTVETRPELSHAENAKKHANRLGQEGKERFLREVDGWVNFALEQYGRRPWSEEFKEQLRQFAVDYAHRSTYIVARERVGDEAGKTLGTLRLISSTYYGMASFVEGKPTITTLDRGVPLPMEILFSKLLPRRWHSPGALAGLPPGLVVGEILEPGNFALLNGLSSQAGQQILAQFLSVLVKPSYGGILLPEAKQLFTYGDVTSVRMYGGKGFRVIDGSAPVSKFGSDWQQLQAAPEDLLRVLDTLQSEKGAGDLWQPLLRSFEYLLAPETNWALAV